MNTRAGKRIQEMQGTRGAFTRILGNLLNNLCECPKMLNKVLGNVQEHSEESLKRFREMFKKIPDNLNLDSFREIYQIFAKQWKKQFLINSSQRNNFCAATYN